jgi:2-methylcitrate dehydratase PrpD
MSSISERLAAWAMDLRFEDLPEQVVRDSCLRVLDVLGLALAGLGTPFGRAVRTSTIDLYPGGCSRIWGRGDSTTVTGAAFANAALSQALEYDDTHNRSIVHMSGPSVAAALALSERDAHCGRDVVTAIAIGNEVSCRVGVAAPGQLHRRGFHPTGLFAPFGVTALASRMLGLTVREASNAFGIAGSYAAGLLQCWVDGTQSKFLHPGAAAQNGIIAAMQGRHGATGPAEVIEGRFGMMAAHLQHSGSDSIDFDAVLQGLGDRWESQEASLKPFPAAHVIHPYIDALLRLKRDNDLQPEHVRRIVCPVAEYIVGIVCEPTREKRRPRSDSHGRVSLQYTLAEALVLGRLGRHAYASDSLADPRILALADRIEYRIDDTLPGPEQFKGVVTVELVDGRTLHATEEFNRGSARNPMSLEEVVAKFDENAADTLDASSRRRLVDQALALDRLGQARDLVGLTIGSPVRT